MPKNIVLCCDGTGNQFIREACSNVLKLFVATEKNKDTQVTFYDPGLGTFSADGALWWLEKKISRFLGLAFGFGLAQNIADAYRFLMDHYVPGDRIYIFGFSRGAFTARVVASLVHKCGILHANNANLVSYALEAMRYEHDPLGYHGFQRAFGVSADIHFLGVWDTVKSVGWIYSPANYPFTWRNPSVRAIRHAVAIDERRKFYRTNLFAEARDLQPDEHHQDIIPDIRQVWFAGVHSDVGGSYVEDESGLSKIPLEWMFGEARSHGLLLDEERVRVVLGETAGIDPRLVDDTRTKLAIRGQFVKPDAAALLHPSLSGWWWIAELLPRKVRKLQLNADGTPQLDAAGRRVWREQFEWSIAKRRTIPPGSLIHHSVRERMQDVSSYRPPNLPSETRDENGTPQAIAP
jgi:uncharacterized protein (DUF2235 family)